MSYIAIDEITKHFDQKTVLKNVSFDVRKGEIMGLIGPNGAGKTTLINIILGLLQPDAGSITIDGLSMAKDEATIKQMIGYIPQEIALIDDSSCWNNLLYFATLYNLKGSERKARCEMALELTGLTEEKGKKVSKLSGGMKRRLNIACATMHDPSILILDEPTVGIDPQSRNYIFEYLLHLNRDKNCTILYTSHYMEEVDRLCDRLFILDEGQEVAFGDKESVRGLVESGRQIEFVTEQALAKDVTQLIAALPGVKDLSTRDNVLLIETLPALFSLGQAIRVLEDNNVTLLSVDSKQISLEQVFLELTGKELRE